MMAFYDFKMFHSFVDKLIFKEVSSQNIIKKCCETNNYHFYFISVTDISYTKQLDIDKGFKCKFTRSKLK